MGAGEFGALSHALEPEAFGDDNRAGQISRIESLAVIFDGKLKRLARITNTKIDLDSIRVGMLDRVVDRLLKDAKDDDLERLRHIRFVDVNISFDSGLHAGRFEFAEKPRQGGTDTQVIDNRRTQVHGNAA